MNEGHRHPPRVFVVNEPTKMGSGGMRRAIDVSPAEHFGELVFVVPAGDPPLDPAPTLARIHEALADYRPQDFVLPVGHPVLIAWVCAVAARKAGGRLNILHWRGDHYRPVRGVLWDEEVAA